MFNINHYTLHCGELQPAALLPGGVGLDTPLVGGIAPDPPLVGGVAPDTPLVGELTQTLHWLGSCPTGLGSCSRLSTI